MKRIFWGVALIFFANMAVADDGLLRLKGGSFVAIDTSSAAKRAGLPLCARHLNFWCLKTPRGDVWNGQINKDAKNHAIFDDPRYGARAFFRTMFSYRYRHGLNSANEILGRYAPASDCIGSVDRDPVTGKCPDGENPTWIYAKRVAKSVGVSPDALLNLFINKATLDRKVARSLARAIARFELGSQYSVSDALIDEGVRLAGFVYADI